MKFKINVFNTIPKQNFMIFNLIFMSHPKKRKRRKIKLNYLVPYTLSPASPRPGRIYAFSFNSLSTVAQNILTSG